MNLQPKTRKYRVSFRNKTEKKCNLSTNKSLKQKSLNINKLILDKSFLNTQDYKVNFTNSVSLINIACKSSISGDPKKIENLQVVNSTYFTNNNSSGTLLIEKEQDSRELESVQVSHTQNLSNHLPLKMWSPKAGSKNNSKSSKFFELVNDNGRFNVYAGITENQDNWISSHNLLENQANAHTCATLDKLSFGQWGIYFCNTGTITAKFIEMARLAVAKKLKKSGRFWIRLCPDTPVTARSAETRMGRGKGGISHYSAKIKAGQVFMEFCGVSEENISKIYQELKKKAPIQIKLVY